MIAVKRPVDPHVYALAAAFVSDVINELPPSARRRTVSGEALVQRAAEAMQIAIEQECEAIREELVDHREYEDAVDSGTGPVLERDR